MIFFPNNCLKNILYIIFYCRFTLFFIENSRLFRDATRFVNGHPTKDVNSLNRDPKRVIFIDWNKDSVGLAMNNALILPKWEGDNSDTSLIGLSHLLQGTVNGF